MFKKSCIINIPVLTENELKYIVDVSEEVIIFEKTPITIINEKIKKGKEKNKEINDCDAIFTIEDQLNIELLRNSNVKYIGYYVTGFDFEINEFCKENNIIVTNVPEYATESVAEYIVGQILNLFRNFSKLHGSILQGKGRFSEPQGLELKGKNIGIIGLGKIGTRVAELLKIFDCNLFYFDIVRYHEKEKKLGIIYKSLEEIIKTSSIITIHASLTKESKGMIDNKMIEKIKSDTIFVNAARGEIVDNKALTERLKKKDIFAILDVGIPEDKKLIKRTKNMKNIILSPHVAFNTKEANLRRSETFLKNIENFLDGKRGKDINEVI